MSDYEKGLRRLASMCCETFAGQNMVEEVLRRELLPLLEAAENVANTHELHAKGALKTELSKWTK